MSKITVIATGVTPRLRLNLVAAERIPAGDTVLQCTQQEIQETRTWRTVQIDLGSHVKNEFLAYVDHSCDPNTLFDIDSLSLNAIKEISEGERVTFFYPGSEVELAQAFQCGCRSDRCLDQIKGAFYLTAEQMTWALDNGICTRFIQNHLDRLLSNGK